MTDTFTGWAATAKGEPLVQMELKLRTWDEDCVDIDITHCGICASDIYTIDEGWGPTDYPCVAGHEIVGIVTRVGKSVKKIQVGDRVGVGPECDSCRECGACKDGFENVCEKFATTTYNSKWPNGDKTYGGYANKWRGDYRWVFKVPNNMSNKDAACFFCAGITTYAPLKHGDVNEKSVVGVLGIGGLGHIAILFAKAMGATVIGMSHSDKKRDYADDLGCDGYINTEVVEDMVKYKHKLTHILCTGTGKDFEWEPYLELLHVNGKFMNVFIPGWKFPQIDPFTLIINQVSISGTAVGSPAEMQEMINFAAEREIKPWINKYKMSDINKAIADFRAGLPKFRFVLENE
ncbi:chaperonin 10-like protein [Thamnidium elegans]|nr:chaperonin 10-like protein [Thamnidium elegans]